MIHIHNVSKMVNDTFSVKDLTFHVNSGEVLGVLGPNGAGKTTLIRLLSGLYRADAGTIRLGPPMSPISPADAQRITGTVTDRLHLYPWLTLMEYLECCAALYGLQYHDWYPRAEEALARFGLRAHRGIKTAELSHGMKQKLNFVRATLHRPSILLMDEPTLGLDPVSVKVLAEYVRSFAGGGGCTVLCTHDLAFATHMCDRVILLSQGRIASHFEVQTAKFVHAIDFRLADPGKAEELGSRLAQAVDGFLSFEGADGYRFKYKAAKGELAHHEILRTLLANEAVVIGFHSSQVDELQQLYEQVASTTVGDTT